MKSRHVFLLRVRPIVVPNRACPLELLRAQRREQTRVHRVQLRAALFARGVVGVRHVDLLLAVAHGHEGGSVHRDEAEDVAGVTLVERTNGLEQLERVRHHAHVAPVALHGALVY